MRAKLAPIDFRPAIDPGCHVRVLLVGALCALGACAAAPGKGGQPTATEATSAPMMDMDMGREPPARSRIEALWAEIEEQRERAGLREPISPGAIESMASQSVVEVRASCEPPGQLTTVCEDVCTLASAICDNAESICRLAGELGHDEWADDKCDRATAACAEATERCCGCD